MRIEIRATGGEVSPALDTLVERRISFSLGKYAARIGRVRIVLGEEGGARHTCRFTAELLSPRISVSSDASAPDIESAIVHAAERIGLAVGRRLEAGRLES